MNPTHIMNMLTLLQKSQLDMEQLKPLQNAYEIKKSPQLRDFLIFKVFQRNNQHSETFSVFFSYVFVMHFVSTSNSFSITIIWHFSNLNRW